MLNYYQKMYIFLISIKNTYYFFLADHLINYTLFIPNSQALNSFFLEFFIKIIDNFII